MTAAELRQLRSTPVVRAIAEEHGVDLRDVTGTGLDGRVTRKDIEAFIASGAKPAPKAVAAVAAVAAPAAPAAPAAKPAGKVDWAPCPRSPCTPAPATASRPCPTCAAPSATA
jgi:pyruvate/2-oxoglutarate dehydrogenase complex dihydrolipoamide acyltransferase (E2) component